MRSIKSTPRKPSVTAESTTSCARRRRGQKPAPIVEYPEPLFTDWIEPTTFHESLALHMHRHGDTCWGLWRALIRPGETFDRTTIQSWTAGRRAPRSAKSFEMLSRIEDRYRLPTGHFRTLLPHPARAVTGHKLVRIAPAEQRRLAWHLPDDFNSRSARERREIVEWVRTHIITGSTEYRRFQAEAMKHRYAIRFPAITGRKRSPKPAPEVMADEDPEALSAAYDAPPRLNDEMQRLVSFKTATLTEIGYQRNGVWGEETSSQKIEHLGLMFGALAAAPKGVTAGFGVPLADLTFGLLVFPTVWDWYVQWRERRRGFYTRWEVDMLRLGVALTRVDTGWIRQMPHLADRLRPIPNLVSAVDIELAQSDWATACDAMYAHGTARAKEVERVAQVHRDPFEPILPILEADSPVAEYRKITEEILRTLPDERRYPRQAAEAVRSFLILRLGLHLGLRQKNLRQLMLCPRGQNPRTERQLETMRRGELRWSDRADGWEVLIPAAAFKNAGSSFFAGRPFRLVLPNLGDLYRYLDAYVRAHRHTLLADAMAMPPIHPGTDSNVAAEIGDEEPEDELAALLDGATFRVRQKVVHQRISQAPMENRAILATREGPEELKLYITCQSPHNIARWVSLALGLPSTSIRVISKDVGGSFGLKNTPWKEECAVICAAWLTGRPLKWTEDRWEALTASCQAREAEMTLDVGFDAQGRMLASHGVYDCNNGAYPQGADSNIAVHMFLWAAYKLPAYSFLSRGWYSNTNGLAAYRGPWAMESLIRETLLDKAARKIGIDPVEIRRRNLLYLKDQPAVSSMGIPVDDITPGECLDKLVDYFDVAAFRKEQAEARAQGRYLGLGMATYIEPTGSAGTMAPMTGELAQVRIEPTGKVTAAMSTHSQGHGTATTMAQCIADRLGVPYEDVTVFEGDSAHGGFGPGAAGSRQGVIGGGAAIRAAEMLSDKVKALASHLYNASPESVTIEDGVVHVSGAPEMSRSIGELAAIAYGEPDRLPPGLETGLEAQFRYQPPPMTLTSAAHACVVEVDADTGVVKILRWISSEDCGTVINPGVVEGQISGGLAQAIGMVLLEDMPYDARGNPLAATFKDYLLPAISDVPMIEFVHANTPSKTIGGMRGVGEGGAIIGPPTLVNAIADALSCFGEIEDLVLPLTPARILDVIEQRNVSGASQVPDVAAALPPPPPAPAPAIEAAPQSAAPTSLASVDGDWNAVLKTPMGPQAMVLTLRTDGDAVSGALSSPEGSQEFTGGTLEGNRVRFDLKVEKPMKITLKYDLEITGDTLAGKCKMGMFGSARVTGSRT